MKMKVNIKKVVVYAAVLTFSTMLSAQSTKKITNEYNQDIVNVEGKNFEFFIKPKDLPPELADRINSNPDAKKLFDRHGLIRVTLDFLHPYTAMKAKFKYDVTRLTPLLPEEEVDEKIPTVTMAAKIEMN